MDEQFSETSQGNLNREKATNGLSAPVVLLFLVGNYALERLFHRGRRSLYPKKGRRGNDSGRGSLHQENELVAHQNEAGKAQRLFTETSRKSKAG